MKKEQIIVTGGLGYIGQVLVPMLESLNYKVHIWDNDLLGLYTSGKIHPVKNLRLLDIRDKKTVSKAMKEILSKGKVKAIINLAAVVGDPACLTDSRLAININCNAVRNLIDISNKHKIKLIHASTCSLYGCTECTIDNPLRENDKLYTVDIYGLTKMQQEKLITENARDSLIFRLGTVYGISPRMRYDLVINVFSALTANNKPINVYGGLQYRPFTHIKDIARAFIYGLKNDLWGIYNLAQFNISIKELAEKFRELFRSEVNINPEIQDPRDYIVSSRKLLAEGYRFETEFEPELKMLVEYSKGVDHTQSMYHNHKLQIENKDYIDKLNQLVK